MTAADFLANNTTRSLFTTRLQPQKTCGLNRLRSAFIFILVVSANFCLANSHQNHPNILKIATWNLEWLDTTPIEPQQARNQFDLQQLKNYAQKLDADIIAVQEVADVASLNALWPATDYKVILSGRNSMQKVAFIIRKNLNYQQNPTLTQLDTRGKQQLRYGISITINPNTTPLTLVNVHLKAGCFSIKSKRSSRSCQTLQQQFTHLNTWAKQQKDGNFILLGDFNRQLKRPQDPLWQTLNQTTVGHLNLKALGHNDASRCKVRPNQQTKLRSYPYFIDHIITSPKASKRYQPKSFKHHAFSIADVKKYHLSDHCPISIKFKL